MSDTHRIEDRLAIIDLLSAYGLYLDQGRTEDWLGVFLPEARMEIPGQPAISTSRALLDMVASAPVGTHVGAPPRITFGERADEATVEQSFIFRGSAGGPTLSGWYEDVVVKRGGHWRIAVRRVHYARRPPRGQS